MPGDSTRAVTYTANTTGSVTGITGNSGTILQNRKLRAFGGLKEEQYGNGYKLLQEFDNRLRIEDYEIKNSSNQTVSNTSFEFNAAGQVTRANGQYYFERYYEYDQVGRLKSNQTKWTGDTDYGAYYQGAGYDVWNNLTSRTSQTWGYVINSQSSYANNRNTWTFSYDNYSDPRTEYWVYDASGNATESGEQTHKYDAAGRKIESLEQTPNQEREQLLIQQTYDGDGQIVKRYEHIEYASWSDVNTTEYNLRSTVFGGEVIAKVTPAGVRGEDAVFDRTGRQIARNGSTVTYLHETPFTATSFESTSSSATAQREFEPFGGEIGTVPPPNETPDWIQVGRYGETGNPLDAQGGCMEDGSPVDCSVVAKRVCVGNPRCMNRENRVGGLGYILAGMFARINLKEEGLTLEDDQEWGWGLITLHPQQTPQTIPAQRPDSKRMAKCLNQTYGGKHKLDFAGSKVAADGTSITFNFTRKVIPFSVTVYNTRRTSFQLGKTFAQENPGQSSARQAGYTSGNQSGNRIEADIADEIGVGVEKGKYSAIGIEAFICHEVGNAIAGFLYANFAGKKIGLGWSHPTDTNDTDAGTAFERCLYGNIVGLSSGNLGNSRHVYF